MKADAVFRKVLIPPVLVLLCLVTIIILFFYLPEYNLIPFPFNIAGIIIIYFGFTIMGKAREVFKRCGIPSGFEKSANLVDEGIFAKTRNPLYLGMFTMLIGLAVCFQNVIGLLVPPSFLLIISSVYIPMEEKLLMESFGDKYMEYKKKTRMWM